MNVQKHGQTWFGVPALLLALVALGGTPARANTYLFSFTAQQVLDALAAPSSQGLIIEQESAYFGIWLKPNLASFSYGSVTGPNPTSQQAWQANTINDPADLGSGTWAGYNKNYNSPYVAILSDANDGGVSSDNIFLRSYYTGSNSPAPPVGWGPNKETITEVIDPESLFQFEIQASAINGPVTISGKASALISGSTGAVTTGTKDFTGLNFSLTETPSLVVPEPGVWVLFLSGGLALLVLLRFRRNPSARPL